MLYLYELLVTFLPYAEILNPRTAKKLIPAQPTLVFTQTRQMNEIQSKPDMLTVLSLLPQQ